MRSDDLDLIVEMQEKVAREAVNDVLDKISADIDKAKEELDGYDPNSLGVFASRVDEIIEKYKKEGAT